MSAGWLPGPAAPEPPIGEAHVWRIRLDAVPPPASELTRDERLRAGRILRPDARRRWSAARCALRRILARYLDVEDPERIALRLEVNDKPRLAGSPPPLRFNLSHSRDLALVAVAGGREVGVDVEWIDEGRDVLELAHHGLRAEEAATVAASPPKLRSAAFHRAWVRREAVAKCFGTGLAAPPPALPVTVIELEVDDEHAAALAVAGMEGADVRRYTLVGSSSDGAGFASR